MQINFREILKGLPIGDKYRMAGNGRIIEVNRDEGNDDHGPVRGEKKTKGTKIDIKE